MNVKALVRAIKGYATVETAELIIIDDQGHSWMVKHAVSGRARDADGRFSGPRVDVEHVPRLPTFP